MTDFTKARISKSGNLITPKGRLSFCQILTAKPNKRGKDMFGTSILIPGTSDIGLLIEATKKCAAEKWGNALPKNLKSPFLKAGEFEYEGYEDGWTLLRPTAIQKPGVVNAAGENVDESSEIYPGRWAILSLRPFAYDVDGNRGVSFGLQNVQLLDHDTNLAGRTRAEDEFEPVDTTSVAGEKQSADSVFG